MSTLITILHVTVCLFLMLTVLMQEGKSGGMGGAFGGSNAGTVFGGSGSSSFLRRLTTVCAATFMLTSVVLAYLASHNAADSLEKFGSSEAKRAAQKQEAIDKGLKGGSGSDAGSASGPSIMMPGPSEMGSGATGSTPSTGSATTPSTGSATTPEAGSAATGSAASPATGSASAEKPAVPATAEKPATPAQPSMTPAPAGKVTPPAAPPAKAPTSTPTKAEKAAPTPPQTPSEKAADKSAEKKPLTGTAAPVNPQPTDVPAPSTNP
ncbi:MAG TPA: preprotein translocase subunit SecG [Kofleriaceae bacterium]|jgi:preprotein translocase subunit SecG